MQFSNALAEVCKLLVQLTSTPRTSWGFYKKESSVPFTRGLCSATHHGIVSGAGPGFFCAWLQVFGQRGQDQMASNCDQVRAEIEEFKKLVPLVQVRWHCQPGTACRCFGCD